MFFSEVWAKADAVLFLRGRLHFHYVDGTRAAANAGAPSVFVAYGSWAVQQLHALQTEFEGKMLILKKDKD
jgi:hypothetical protein